MTPLRAKMIREMQLHRMSPRTVEASAAQTLLEFGRNNLGGKVGFTIVLHTWDQALKPHYHVHVLFAAGAFKPTGGSPQPWRAPRAQPTRPFEPRACSIVVASSGDAGAGPPRTPPGPARPRGQPSRTDPPQPTIPIDTGSRSPRHSEAGSGSGSVQPVLCEVPRRSASRRRPAEALPIERSSLGTPSRVPCLKSCSFAIVSLMGLRPIRLLRMRATRRLATLLRTWPTIPSIA